MYRHAAAISPERLEAIATGLHVEMLEAGDTSVCEFHDLHHEPDGRPYADDATLAHCLLHAAETAGIGLAMLPVLYQTSGFGAVAPSDSQRRFIRSTEPMRDCSSICGQGGSLSAAIRSTPNASTRRGPTWDGSGARRRRSSTAVRLGGRVRSPRCLEAIKRRCAATRRSGQSLPLTPARCSRSQSGSSAHRHPVDRCATCRSTCRAEELAACPRTAEADDGDRTLTPLWCPDRSSVHSAWARRAGCPVLGSPSDAPPRPPGDRRPRLTQVVQDACCAVLPVVGARAASADPRCFFNFFMSLALFCFSRRVPRSLSALMVISGWLGDKHGSRARGRSSRYALEPPVVRASVVPPGAYRLPARTASGCPRDGLMAFGASHRRSSQARERTVPGPPWHGCADEARCANRCSS